MPASPRAAQTHRPDPTSSGLTSIDQVELNATYWIYAAGHEREVRALFRGRRGIRVQVAFWSAYGTSTETLCLRWVPFWALKREKPVSEEWGFVLTWPAPTVAQIGTAMETLR